MRAAVFKQAGTPLQIENVPDPTPGPRQVVLKVARCGICGTDLHSTQADQQSVPAGAVLGHEFTGEVVALGKGVDCVRVGDRIAAMPLLGCGQCRSCLAGEPGFCPSVQISYGGFAEYTAAIARESVHLPSTLSLADGALIEPLAVSLHGVAAGGITAGAAEPRAMVTGTVSLDELPAAFERLRTDPVQCKVLVNPSAG